MNKLRAIILSIWLIGLTALLIGGRYSLFIRAELWPLLLATTVMFGLLLFALVGRAGKMPTRVTSAAILQGALLMLPLAYLATNITGAAASGLDSFALQKRSLGVADSGSDTQTETTATAANNDMRTLAYIMHHPKSLAGHHLITEGRISRDDSMPADQAIVFRFVVVCCAADATPAHAIVQSADLSKFKNDDWVRVDGQAGVVEKDGVHVPIIKNATVSAIATPQEPYLTPY